VGPCVSGVVNPDVERILGAYQLPALPKVLRCDSAARLAKHLFCVGVLRRLGEGGVDLMKAPFKFSLRKRGRFPGLRVIDAAARRDVTVEFSYPLDEREGVEANNADRYDHVDEGDHRDTADVCGREPHYDRRAINRGSIVDLPVNGGVDWDGAVENSEIRG